MEMINRALVNSKTDKKCDMCDSIINTSALYIRTKEGIDTCITCFDGNNVQISIDFIGSYNYSVEIGEIGYEI